MTEKHPYVQAPSHISQLVRHLRRSFPNTVTADTIKKLGLAPRNESYLINTLRFLKLIDESGNKTEPASRIFSIHKDQEFQNEFSQLVRDAYSGLFELHGDEAWELEMESLISFFRQEDKSTEIVGKNQATTFRTLAAVAGHGKLRERESKTVAKRKKATTEPSKKEGETSNQKGKISANAKRDFGLTVRIEINLPAEGNQRVYDMIFKSIRENLLNG